MQPILLIKNVSKQLGSHTILNDISFQVETGQIVGIMGRNGSGKSMLFKAVCGLLRIDSGEILINGKNHWQYGALDNVGAIIEHPGFLPNLNGLNNLKLLGSIRKVVSKDSICSVLEKVGLDPQDKLPYKKLSLGTRQKLSIAAAIMENPQFLILDEPCNNLDIQSMGHVRNLLRSLNEEHGTTILLSSHNPEDFAVLCTKTFKIESGRLEESNS